MKTVLFFTVSIVLSLSCYSQNKFANNWLFGVNAGITFNTTPPSALPVSKVNTDMQTSSISDKEGNLLFYSDGYSVWNRNHEIMPNGNLNPISFNPLTLAMLRPYSPNSYFLLSMQSNCVNIYLVDMSLNNGLGDISSFGFFLDSGNELAACTLHNDGKNYWLVFSDDQYLYAYKVNQQGVDVVPIKTRLYTQEQPCTFSFSNSGYKFCMCYDEHTEIYEFNKTSGVFVHVQTLSVSSYFSCFSPDETKLYLSDIVSSGSATYGLSKVYQYDFTENHLYTLLTENLNNGVSYALQAAPDNKIYLGFVGKKSLEVINEPNLAGTACDLQKNAISLGNGMMQLMFPLFVQSYFAPPNFYYQKINCSSSPVQFLISGVGSYFSILWDFGDGSTSTDLNPSHTYVNSGTYTVQVTVTYEDGTSQSLTKTITIIEKPKTLTINHN